MDVDPLSLAVLGALFVGLLVLVLVAWIVRAWVRSMVRMVKLAIWAGFTLLFVGIIVAAGVWFLYGDAIRAAMG